jgi:hypothetical protein
VHELFDNTEKQLQNIMLRLGRNGRVQRISKQASKALANSNCEGSRKRCIGLVVAKEVVGEASPLTSSAYCYYRLSCESIFINISDYREVARAW